MNLERGVVTTSPKILITNRRTQGTRLTCRLGCSSSSCRVGLVNGIAASWLSAGSKGASTNEDRCVVTCASSVATAWRRYMQAGCTGGAKRISLCTQEPVGLTAWPCGVCGPLLLRRHWPRAVLSAALRSVDPSRQQSGDRSGPRPERMLCDCASKSRLESTRRQKPGPRFVPGEPSVLLRWPEAQLGQLDQRSQLLTRLVN